MGIVRTDKVGTKKIIENALSRIQIGAESTFGNMTIFPLLNGDSGSADYLTLDEALGQSWFELPKFRSKGACPS